MCVYKYTYIHAFVNIFIYIYVCMMMIIKQTCSRPSGASSSEGTESPSITRFQSNPPFPSHQPSCRRDSQEGKFTKEKFTKGNHKRENVNPFLIPSIICNGIYIRNAEHYPRPVEHTFPVPPPLLPPRAENIH